MKKYIEYKLEKFVGSWVEKHFEEKLKSYKEEKEKLRNEFSVWLEEAKKSADTQVFRVDHFLTTYHPFTCDSCGKGFLAHYGGFYRTKHDKDLGMTKVACSSTCLEKLKDSIVK